MNVALIYFKHIFINYIVTSVIPVVKRTISGSPQL